MRANVQERHTAVNVMVCVQERQTAVNVMCVVHVCVCVCFCFCVCVCVYGCVHAAQRDMRANMQERQTAVAFLQSKTYMYIKTRSMT